MVMQKKIIIFLMNILVLVFVPLGYIQAQLPQQTLAQYLSDLQKNPNDTALREKIIKHVQTMRPAPALSKEAERFMTRGAVAMKSAKDVNDFKDSVTEFEKATMAAPWLANAYYNLGVAQAKAGLYDAAIKSLKLYLLAAPNASDANSVEKLIYEIEYRQEKTAKESSPEAIGVNKQKEYEEWLKKIDGAQWRDDQSTSSLCHDYYLEVHGRDIQLGYIITRPTAPCANPDPYLGKASSQFRGMIEGRSYIISTEYGTYNGIISENGEDISQTFTSRSEPVKSFFKRVKNPRWTIWNR
jgi:tetratricopeptide (TPR) repeat protein